MRLNFIILLTFFYLAAPGQRPRYPNSGYETISQSRKIHINMWYDSLCTLNIGTTPVNYSKVNWDSICSKKKGSDSSYWRLNLNPDYIDLRVYNNGTNNGTPIDVFMGKGIKLVKISPTKFLAAIDSNKTFPKINLDLGEYQPTPKLLQDNVTTQGKPGQIIIFSPNPVWRDRESLSSPIYDGRDFPFDGRRIITLNSEVIEVSDNKGITPDNILINPLTDPILYRETWVELTKWESPYYDAQYTLHWPHDWVYAAHEDLNYPSPLMPPGTVTKETHGRICRICKTLQLRTKYHGDGENPFKNPKPLSEFQRLLQSRDK